MQYPLDSRSENVTSRKLIQVRSKVANRFYEPVLLLLSLNEAYIHNQPPKAPDLSLDTAQSPELAFHGFVNKLGQLCDSERGGNTVTAFVVLKYPDRIQYRFASNQREARDLSCVKSFISYIIQSLGRAKKDELQGMISHMLRKVLAFNRPRVGLYVKTLKKEITPCMAVCAREGTYDSKSILEKLDELQALLWFFDETELDTDTFSKNCEDLIDAIDRLYKSDIDELIRQKTNEGRMNESKCWCELRHATGRLLSYLQAIKVLISMRHQWPELFEDFEVCWVASSTPAPCPVRIRHVELSTDAIIGRMTSDPDLIQGSRAQALELQKFGLDDIIRRRLANRSFRPYVHAELVLLESLERDGGTHPARFFNGYKYIGCSKPSCRLCDYYFSVHGSGVEVRPTHRNLYLNWRMPDVFHDQGPQVGKERENIMNKILVLIRKDAFRTMSEKIPERKHHDSNTEPTYPIASIPSRVPEDLENLASHLEDLSIEYAEYDTMHNSIKRASFDGSRVFAAESDEEQDGGVRI